MSRPPRTQEQKKIRLNLDMHPTDKQRIEKIRDDLRADSMGEVIRRSLALYEMFLDGKAKGDRFIVRDVHGKDQQILIL